MEKNKKAKHRPYYQISGKTETIERFHQVRVRLAPKYSVDGFMTDVLDVYEKAHCPECLMPVTFKVCSCKSPERL